MKALEVLKILVLTRLLPGVYCWLLLVDQGDEVIKIEQPGSGDYNREFEPINMKESGSFLLLNRNKKSITLNLKSGEGRIVFLKLLKLLMWFSKSFAPASWRVWGWIMKPLPNVTRR